MTASTRTVTLSRVIPSCAGTGRVTICMLTFVIRSATGQSRTIPGALVVPGSTLPNRNTTPRSYWRTIRTLVPTSVAATRRTAAQSARSTIISPHPSPRGPRPKGVAEEKVSALRPWIRSLLAEAVLQRFLPPTIAHDGERRHRRPVHRPEDQQEDPGLGDDQ